MSDLRQPVLISFDGRFYWDGRLWAPIAAAFPGEWLSAQATVPPKLRGQMRTCSHCEVTHGPDGYPYFTPCPTHLNLIRQALRSQSAEFSAKARRELAATNNPDEATNTLTSVGRMSQPQPRVAAPRKRKGPVLFYIRGPRFGPIYFPSTPVRGCQSTLLMCVTGATLAVLVLR